MARGRERCITDRLEDGESRPLLVQVVQLEIVVWFITLSHDQVPRVARELIGVRLGQVVEHLTQGLALDARVEELERLALTDLFLVIALVYSALAPPPAPPVAAGKAGAPVPELPSAILTKAE